MRKVWLDQYDEGVPETIDYPERTVEQLLAGRAAVSPDAVITSHQGACLTYRQMNDLVDRMAAGLQQLGIQPGDRVAIHLPNCPQFVFAYYGALRAGAIAVPCNPVYVPRELAYQLSDSGAKAIVTLDALYQTVAQVRPQTALEHVIVAQDQITLTSPAAMEGEGEHGIDLSDQANTYRLQSLLAQWPAQPTKVDLDLDGTALLMYTGGTTGVSKGAQLSHRNLTVNAAQFAHWLKTPDQAPRLLTALPLYHSYAMTTCMNHAVYAGGMMILVPNPRDLSGLLGTIDREKPTIYPGVPAMYVAINSSPDVAVGRYDISSIQVCISGAVGLPVEVQARFQSLTGGRLVEGYGLSEASPVTHVNPVSGGNRVGYIGVPLPDTLAKIVDVDTGARELAPGEVGELCVQGPQVMKGYWNRPDETADVLRDGWLYTGDIAAMTEDGYFQIVDRKKDMILGAGGFNVYPREIEDVLYAHPKVREAVAAGVPVGEKGERVKVWIVLKQGETATADEILAFCEENLAPYKRPRAVEFRAELPTSLVGKFLRRVLVEEEAKLADS